LVRKEKGKGINYKNNLGKERRNPSKEIIREGEAKTSKFLA